MEVIVRNPHEFDLTVKPDGGLVMICLNKKDKTAVQVGVSAVTALEMAAALMSAVEHIQAEGQSPRPVSSPSS